MMFVWGAEHQNKKCLMGLPERTLMSCGTYKSTLHIQNNILFTKACLSRCCYICYSMWKFIQACCVCVSSRSAHWVFGRESFVHEHWAGQKMQPQWQGKRSQRVKESGKFQVTSVTSFPIHFITGDTLQGCKLQCGSCQTSLKH